MSGSPIPAGARRPSLLVHVLFHPDSERARALARSIHGALNTDPLVPGLRVPTSFCPTDGGRPTEPPDLEQADRNVVVVLADALLAVDEEWCAYAADLWLRADATVDIRCLPFELAENVYPLDERMAGASFVRAYEDETRPDAQRDRVVRRLVIDLCRFLHDDADDATDHPEAPTKLFISHTKADLASEPRVVEELKIALTGDQPIRSWIDSGEIEGGSRFAERIAEGVEDSSLLCILTNNYASREWCRREVLLAKRAQRPLVVVDALTTQEIRSFPYLGNLPVVRWTGDPQPVIDLVLKETLRDLHARAELERMRRDNDVIFTRPPELLTLTDCDEGETVLYPDPPLGVEEVTALERVGVHITTPLQRLTTERALEGLRIALSMSESADIARFGFDLVHLSSTMLEVSRYLMLEGATLVYGGHLGDEGYTQQLAELVRAHNSIPGVDEVERIENFVGWPVGIDAATTLRYKAVATLVRVPRPADVSEALHPDLDEGPAARFSAARSPEHRYAWARGMTEMRRTQTESVDARVVLGGTVGPTTKRLPDGTTDQAWYQSRIPGVLEEVLISAAAGQPVFLLGAFGGVPALVMDVLDGRTPPEITWDFHRHAPHAAAMRELYESRREWYDYAEMVTTLRRLGLTGLNAHLNEDEHRRMVHARQATSILEPLLAGLVRVREADRNAARPAR